MFLQAETNDATRWRTYLGMPIWHGADNRGDFLVGVITLASTKSLETSSVAESNLDKLSSTLPVMQACARRIILPSR